MWNSNWIAPAGYKGHRTSYRQACRVKVKYDYSNRYNLGSLSDWIYEREEWCEENCSHPWSYIDGCWWFDKTNEAILFKMVWGGV